MFTLGMLRIFAAVVAVASPSPTPSALPEIAHVVTSDRSDQTLRNTTRTTYVVTAEAIARRGYRTVSDALADVPGVEINRYGPIGAQTNYGIRGSSSAQVLVLVNGVPAAGGFANSVALSTMSTAGVNRIEIVEGGGSTLYGTGAIGGIINVITTAQNTTPAASLELGSFGDRTFSASGKGFSFERIVAQNAYSLPSSLNPVFGGANPTTHSDGDYEATTARFGWDQQISKVGVALRATLESDHIGAPGPLDFTSPTSREDDVNADASLAFTLKRAQSTPTLEFGGSRQQLAFGCDAGGADPNCFSSPSLSTESRTSVGLRNVVTGTSERLIYGVDLSRGVVRSDSGSAATFDALAQSAVYVQENWATRTGELYVGLRGERDGSLGGEFSPSLGWRTSLGGNFILKANAATAFRAPNASELFFPGYGSVAQGRGLLQPERAQVGDLSITDRTLLDGVTLGWFTNRTSQLIVATVVGTDPATGFPIYAPLNVAHAFMQGFTFDAATKPAHGVNVSLRVTDLYRALNIDTGARLPNDPTIAADLGLNVSGKPLGSFDEAGIAFHTEGSRAWSPFSPEPAFEQSFGYQTVDAFARFRLSNHLLITLRGYNLGNARYAEVSGFPQAPRNFALQLTTK
jgi:vitamin B12 transporter